MKRLEDEFCLLLEAVDTVDAELAKSVLEAGEVPCLIQGPDFDVVELGRAAHDMLRGTNVYVPKEAEEKARALLAEAWKDLPEERRG